MSRSLQNALALYGKIYEISKTHTNENEVVVALQKLENRKPPGFDGIVTEHAEIVTEHIKTLKVSYINIVKLLNAIKDAECYPQQFKEDIPKHSSWKAIRTS